MDRGVWWATVHAVMKNETRLNILLRVEIYGIQFPDQEWNPAPLHWKPGVLATEPPGKPPQLLFIVSSIMYIS